MEYKCLNNSTDCGEAVQDRLNSDRSMSNVRSLFKRVSGVQGSPAVTVDAVDAVRSSERHHVVQVRAGAVDLRAGVRAVIQLLPAQSGGRRVGQVHVRVFGLVDL